MIGSLTLQIILSNIFIYDIILLTDNNGTMKLKYNKLLVSVVIVTFVTFGLLLAECFGKSIDYQEKSIFPSFVSQGFFETRTNNEEYIIEV